MEPEAGEFPFDFCSGVGWVFHAEADAFEFAGLADGRGEEVIFLSEGHAFPDRGLLWGWRGHGGFKFQARVLRTQVRGPAQK